MNNHNLIEAVQHQIAAFQAVGRLEMAESLEKFLYGDSDPPRVAPEVIEFQQKVEELGGQDFRYLREGGHSMIFSGNGKIVRIQLDTKLQPDLNPLESSNIIDIYLADRIHGIRCECVKELDTRGIKPTDPFLMLLRLLEEGIIWRDASMSNMGYDNDQLKVLDYDHFFKIGRDDPAPDYDSVEQIQANALWHAQTLYGLNGGDIPGVFSDDRHTVAVFQRILYGEKPMDAPYIRSQLLAQLRKEGIEVDMVPMPTQAGVLVLRNTGQLQDNAIQQRVEEILLRSMPPLEPNPNQRPPERFI